VRSFRPFSPPRHSMILSLLPIWVLPVPSAVPHQINHQGVVKISGVPFTGPGQFRFAIVDPDSGQAVWSNDGSINGGFGVPTTAVSLEVTNGLYSVALGDTDIPNMTAIPPDVFEDPNLVLRVWFDDGTNGNERLSPDHPLTSSPYAFHSATSDSAFNGTPSGFSILGESEEPPEGFTYTGLPVEAGDVSRTRASMPTPRSGHGVGVANNRIYVMGGFDGAMTVGVNEEYDPVTNTWETKATMLTPRSRFAVGTIQGKLYAIGGTAFPSTQNEEYDPVTDDWTAKAPMPSNREDLGIGVVDDKIYAIGGEFGGGIGDANEEYDPTTDVWTPKAPMPTNRFNPAVGVVRKPGLVIGPAKEEDSKGTIMGPRNIILVVGGSDGGVFPTDANEEYDPQTDMWTTRPSLPADRDRAVAGVAENLLYVIGGVDENFDQVRTNFVFDIRSNTWTTKKEIPTLRIGMQAASALGKIYVLGGGDSEGNRLGANEEYTPPKFFFVHQKD